MRKVITLILLGIGISLFGNTVSAEGKQMDEAHFIQLLSATSAGDKSTINASLQEPNSQIGTSVGSKNYEVLSYLAEVGMAERMPKDTSLPPMLQEKLAAFQIKEEAKPRLLEILKK